ncbi:MAG: DUF2851 family protein [Flavobacteriaceae bacterium]|nr:DUF2851 family protein [Flavobacteriaceae bacterium]
MKEDFLQYIWQYRLFAAVDLVTTDNQLVSIVKPGQLNRNAGPDFFNAQIKIDHQLWAGNVEIHIKSSDWYIHGHEKDSNYDNVILHVVWEHNVAVYRKDGSMVPSLVLKDYVKPDILYNYKNLVLGQDRWINCEKSIASIDEQLMNTWFEKLYIERLEEKTLPVYELLKVTKNDWEAVLFKMLLRNFGLKTNKEAFVSLASGIDFSVIRKQRQNLLSMEALVFGLAGFLEEPVEDPYFLKLHSEFNYLRAKYKLSTVFGRFQFFRMRPANFPTIRLAQLSALVHYHGNLFSKILELNSADAYYEVFQSPVSEYWKTHYSFTSTSTKSNKTLTKDFVDLLIINTVIPLKFVYNRVTGQENNEELFKGIRELRPEKNSIIDKFSQTGVIASNAFDSQALLQLKNNYCSKHRCLNCSIGNILLARNL